MTLKTYLSRPDCQSLKAVCYYGRNGKYYYLPIDRVYKTKAMDRQIDQFVDAKDGGEVAWLC